MSTQQYKNLIRFSAIGGLLAAMFVGQGSVVAAESETESKPVWDDSGNYIKMGGYLRTWFAYNLKNHSDSNSTTRSTGDSVGGEGKAMMERVSLALNMDAKTGPLLWKGIWRADRERLTEYQRRLQSLARAGTPGGPGSDVLKVYNQSQLRELYFDTDINERLSVRVGKQQVVWGETDFFHPNDLMHGFDNRWRGFGEPESDELRKPQIMLNAKLQVPEANGALQVVLRPGWDDTEDIGNSYDIYGGRWMGQPYKGVDFLATAFDFDYRHPEGDYKDVTGGVRWSALAGPVNYAFSYQHVLYPDFTLNPCVGYANGGVCDQSVQYKVTPTNKVYGDFFYPTLDVFGASISGENLWLDAVLNAEVAYQKGRLFNTGTGLAFGPGQQGTYGPVVKKDVIQTTLRLDKQLRLQDLLGTVAPSFFSMQVFDTWIKSYDAEDDIVAALGNSAPMKEHSTMVTAFIQFPYLNNRLVYGLAAGQEIQSRNSFVIPSISYSYGNNWRLSADAVLFQAKNRRTDDRDPGAHRYPLAGFNQQDYLTLRATYQF